MSTMQESQEIDRAVELAVLREQFRSLNEHVTRLEKRLGDMDEKMDKVLDTLTEARGGWRVLMGVGGAASLVTGLLMWVVERFIKI